MAAKPITSVDDYLAAQPPPARTVLERVRATIRRALPGATEGISYRIPIYRLDGRMVLYFAGFSRHWSIYPATARVLGVLGEALTGRVHSKATIRFGLDEPVPARLVARIAKARADEVAEAKAVKAARPPRGATAAKGKPVARRNAAAKAGKQR